MNKLDDKNILLIYNGNHCLISINGSIQNYGGNEITYRKRKKIIKQGNVLTKQEYETLRIGNKITTYNLISGFWSTGKVVVT